MQNILLHREKQRTILPFQPHLLELFPHSAIIIYLPLPLHIYLYLSTVFICLPTSQEIILGGIQQNKKYKNHTHVKKHAHTQKNQ